MNINLTLIAQAISFAIFIWFTARFVWPPLMKAVDERQKKIADGLAAAEQGQMELTQAESRVEELLNGAKQQGQEILASAQKRADEIVEQAKESAKTEGERILTAARAEIDQERYTAREELRGQVATLAVSGAEQILMREVNPAVHKDLLDKLAANL